MFGGPMTVQTRTRLPSGPCASPRMVPVYLPSPPLPVGLKPQLMIRACASTASNVHVNVPMLERASCAKAAVAKHRTIEEPASLRCFIASSSSRRMPSRMTSTLQSSTPAAYAASVVTQVEVAQAAANATAKPTPTIDKPPITDASQSASRSSSHTVFHMCVLPHLCDRRWSTVRQYVSSRSTHLFC
jgi:hypothetical protein